MALNYWLCPKCGISVYQDHLRCNCGYITTREEVEKIKCSIYDLEEKRKIRRKEEEQKALEKKKEEERLAIEKQKEENKKVLQERLNELKELLDTGIITENEYSKIRRPILDKFLEINERISHEKKFVESCADSRFKNREEYEKLKAQKIQKLTEKKPNPENEEKKQSLKSEEGSIINHYYQILELKPNASKEEIKQAYKDLLTVWNPEKFTNEPSLQQKAREKAKEIDEAYKKLILYLLKSSEQTSQPEFKENDNPKESQFYNQSSDTYKAQEMSQSEKNTTQTAEEKSKLAPHATCWQCGTKFYGTPKRTFLGFQKLTCPGCLETMTYPLTSGYRVTYWIILGYMVLLFLTGYFYAPGLLGIAVIVAVIRDMRLRKQLSISTNKSLNTETKA